MFSVDEYILNGGIFIKPDFLYEKDFKDLEKTVKKIKMFESYQPRFYYFGNRFQAYPCYEAQSKKITNLMKNNIAKIFNRELIDFSCIIRKTISEELKKSKVNTKYGLIHKDDKQFASVLHLDQSVSGGTGFFENSFDKYADIDVGAFPNRILIYNGLRSHAPIQDYTYKERYVIATFWN